MGRPDTGELALSEFRPNFLETRLSVSGQGLLDLHTEPEDQALPLEPRTHTREGG